MAKITYPDKNKNGVGEETIFRDSDANEVKNSVNTLHDSVDLKVDEEAGKSLVLDTEIAKIHSHVWGSMFADDSTRTIVIAVVETVYPLGGGLSEGGSSGVTFQNAKELKCLTAGFYKVDWTCSIKSTTDFTVEGFATINGAEMSNTSNAVRTKENGTEYNLSGTGILTLLANDLVGVAFESESGTGTITVTHTSLVLLKIG